MSTDPNPFASPASETGWSQSLVDDDEQFRREHLDHEKSIRSVGTLYFIGGVFMSLSGLMLLMRIPMMGATGAVICILCGVVALLSFLVGSGLRNLDPRIRTPVGILSTIGLLLVPIGTIISVYVLYLLYSARGVVVFSDEYKRVIEATPHVRYRTSTAAWIVLIVLAGLVVVGFAAALLGGSV